MKFNKSHVLTLALGASLGVGGVLIYKNVNNLNQDLVSIRQASHTNADGPHVFKEANKDRVIKQQAQASADSSQSMSQIRANIRKQMDKMMGNAFAASPIFDRDLSMDNGIKISQGEDGQYKFVKISGEGVDKDSLDVQIKDGMVSISGRVEKKEGDGKTFQSTSISSFSQSFNAPNGVNQDDVKMVSENDAIVLKFKKI